VAILNIGDIKSLSSQVLGQYEKNSVANKTDSRADANQASGKPAGYSASPEVEVDFSSMPKDFVRIKLC